VALLSAATVGLALWQRRRAGMSSEPVVIPARTPERVVRGL
jgi:hypothetical protein